MVNKETKGTESPSLGRSKTSGRSLPGISGSGVPLVVNYNPFLSCLRQVIRKNLCSLQQDKEVKQLFTPVTFASFHSVRTFTSHLVRAKIIQWGRDLLDKANVTEILAKFSKLLQKLTHFNLLLIRRFTGTIIDIHAMINICTTSCCVRYVVCSVTVKIITNLDTGGIIIRIKIGKV